MNPKPPWYYEDFAPGDAWAIAQNKENAMLRENDKLRYKNLLKKIADLLHKYEDESGNNITVECYVREYDFDNSPPFAEWDGGKMVENKFIKVLIKKEQI